MRRILKIITITLRRAKVYFVRRFPSVVSYLILLCCIVLFLVALCSNITHRVPMISYVSEKISFPQKYSLDGVVKILDGDEIVNASVEVSLGGFSTSAFTDEQFELRFVSDGAKNIPVVITFLYQGKKYTEVEQLLVNSDYSIRHVFNINVGE